MLVEKKTLEENGYAVISECNGPDAIKTFKSNSDIDLVLMDIDLGEGLDGAEVAQEILKQREVPVIFVSNHTEKKYIEKMESITAYGYIQKNPGETVLLASIKMAFKLFDANQNISNELAERKRTEEALKKSELKYRSLIEFSSDVVFCVDQNGTYEFVNHVFAATFGKTPDYFIGKTFWDIYPKEHADQRQKTSLKVFETGESQSVEVTVPLPDRNLYFIAKANPLKDETGKVVLNLTHATDITDRKIAEEKINALLAEKELVLKEVHHRIKNNMNTINSLLSLQAGTLSDPVAIGALEDAGNRVQSMMVLYDKLYQSTEYQEISTATYIPSLIDEILWNFPNHSNVTIIKNIDNFILSVNKMQPLGIIINELLTNTMKYAFVGRGEGAITVSAILEGERVVIKIQDNGVGIPESITFENSTGFGLMLVKGLTKQLNGSIHIERDKGTSIVLEFKRGSS